MRFVTTCAPRHIEEYAYRLKETQHLLPGELVWHVGDPGKSFTEKHKGYVAPNYLFDVCRFSHKVYAAHQSLIDYDGIGVWIDADCVVRKELPASVIVKALDGAYMAMLKRAGMYTETGFWIVDCSHPRHAEFMDAWLAWYETGAFRCLANWTDCETLDATVRRFERDGHIRTVSLSGEHERHSHPLTQIPLGQYIDHCKGGRKALGYSPEAR